MTAEVWEGVVWLWRQSFLRDTALLVAGSNLLFQALVLIVIVIARDQGASATAIGVMLAGFGLGGVLASPAAPGIQRRMPMNGVIIGANWVWALLMPAIAIAPNPYVLGGILALMAFVGPAWNVVVGAARHHARPPAGPRLVRGDARRLRRDPARLPRRRPSAGGNRDLPRDARARRLDARTRGSRDGKPVDPERRAVRAARGHAGFRRG